MMKNINNVLAKGFIVMSIAVIIAIFTAVLIVENPTIFVEEGIIYKLVDFIELINEPKNIVLTLCDLAIGGVITAVIFGVGFLLTEESNMNENELESR